MTWDKIKNFVFGGGAAIVLVMVLAWMDYRAASTAADAWTTEAVQLKLNAMIDAKLAGLDVPSDASIVEISGRQDTTDANVANNTTNITLTQSQLQQVANILMQPPGE